MRPSCAVIGAGAAGVFAALEIKRLLPECDVVVFEKSQEVLSKVRVSGKGRCNLTNACFDPRVLSSYYPRGGSFLLPLFVSFQPRDTIHWFEERGVPLKEEAEGRMFPTTDQGNCMKILFTI